MEWVFIIIIIIAFLGNGYLLSGYDVEGDIAVLMVAIALIVDALIILFIVMSIKNKIDSVREETERERIAKEIQRKKILQENITKIVRRFKPTPIDWVPKGSALQVKTEWLNQDVIYAVNVYKKRINELIEERKSIDSQINKILEHQGIYELDCVLKYLESATSELSELKSRSDEIYRQIAGLRITLKVNDSYTSLIIHKTFDLLKTSKKVVSNVIDVNKFVIAEMPKELNMFTYSQEPVILSVYGFSYCLFENVILIFDSDGRFSSAIDPSSIKILVKRKITSTQIGISPEPQILQYIASDSKRTKEGNSVFYEYANVIITINEYPFEFIVSSQCSIEAFDLFGVEYCRQHNHLHNSTKDLIELLKIIIGDGNDIIDELITTSISHQKSSNCFCSLAFNS